MVKTFPHPTVELGYDTETAAEMLAALAGCPVGKRLDTVAVIVKIFVEARMDSLREEAS